MDKTIFDKAFCAKCMRPLSAAGREIGIVIYVVDHWEVRCATRCSGLFTDPKLSELTDYFLNGGK